MNRIRELRMAANMSQAQVGAKLGCHGTAVSKLELETRQLDPAMIHALCDLFDCTSDYLLGRSETPWPTITDQQAEFLLTYDALPGEIRDAVDGLMAPYRERAKKKETA